ncbi:MAG: rhodanese-like domain-containing protein [Bacteroidota bacterium]|jgi:rhodanese-related sulfurtransferase
MKEITVQELKTMRDKQEDFQLIDVREPYEFEHGNIDGKLIPMGTVLEHINDISREKKVVIHCRSGMRSASVINALEKQFGFTNLYNLKGGILAWAAEIDRTVSV